MSVSSSSVVSGLSGAFLQGFVQGAAELLPISSSAHVIFTQHLLGLDPSHPNQTLMLVVLHTGTMFSILLHYYRLYLSWSLKQWALVVAATAMTGCFGLTFKALIERFWLQGVLQIPEQEAHIEWLFKSQTLMACSLFLTGCVLLSTLWLKKRGGGNKRLGLRQALWIGFFQSLVLPLRGLSRSGVTITSGLWLGLEKKTAEAFSFALALALTPVVLLREAFRFYSAQSVSVDALPVWEALLGFLTAFFVGLGAIRLLEHVFQKNRAWVFGLYAWVFASIILIRKL